MMTMESVATFFGWCTIINMGILYLSAFMIMGAGDWVKRTHSRMFKVESGDLDKLYFSYIATMKIFVIVCNLTPWIALKIMAG